MARVRKIKIITALDIMSLPAILYLIINNYIPMYGLVIAFKKVDFRKGLYGGDWIGFKNFEYLFKTRDAFVMTRNTLLYNLVFIVVMTTLGIMVGIMLSEIRLRYMTKFYQTTILLPQLISVVIIANLVFAFLATETGLINKSILEPLGYPTVNFYSTPKYWPFILVFVNTWSGIGYSSLIYFASVIGIDRELYDAALVDGAGKLKQIFHITLPLLKPTIVMLTLMSVGRIFSSNFGLFYQVPMNMGALYNVTQTIDTYVYRALLQQNNIAMSSAAGAYQSIVGFVTVLIANWIVRRIDRESALI